MAAAIEINDRRRRRSDDPGTALRYQLEQVIDDFELMSCVLSDANGRVLAEAHDFDDVDDDTCAVDAEPHDTLLDDGFDDGLDDGSEAIDVTDDIDCVEFRSQGVQLFITAQGRDESFREVALYRVVLGAKRIHRDCGLN